MSTRYTIKGHAGEFVVAGNAYFHDDEGNLVEHDWVRAFSTDDGEETWVPESDLTLVGDARGGDGSADAVTPVGADMVEVA